MRLASLQGIHVVIGIDDGATASASVRRDIEALANLPIGMNTRLTVIQAARPGQAARLDRTGSWSNGPRLDPLTRSQTDLYLASKLTFAGCESSVFTPRAVTRLHCASAGVPRSIEHLATRCLMTGAADGLEEIPPELVDALDEQ